MREPLGDVFRSRWRGCAFLVIVGAPVATFVCWFFGADIWHAIAIAAGVCAAGVAWAAWPDEQLVLWHKREEWRSGGRPEVARLSWSLYGRRGRASVEALRRVQAIGRRRLALYQLDLLEPSHAPGY